MKGSKRVPTVYGKGQEVSGKSDSRESFEEWVGIRAQKKGGFLNVFSSLRQCSFVIMAFYSFDSPEKNVSWIFLVNWVIGYLKYLSWVFNYGEGAAWVKEGKIQVDLC